MNGVTVSEMVAPQEDVENKNVSAVVSDVTDNQVDNLDADLINQNSEENQNQPPLSTPLIAFEETSMKQDNMSTGSFVGQSTFGARDEGFDIVKDTGASVEHVHAAPVVGGGKRKFDDTDVGEITTDREQDTEMSEETKESSVKRLLSDGADSDVLAFTTEMAKMGHKEGGDPFEHSEYHTESKIITTVHTVTRKDLDGVSNIHTPDGVSLNDGHLSIKFDDKMRRDTIDSLEVQYCEKEFHTGRDADLDSPNSHDESSSVHVQMTQVPVPLGTPEALPEPDGTYPMGVLSDVLDTDSGKVRPSEVPSLEAGPGHTDITDVDNANYNTGHGEPAYHRGDMDEQEIGMTKSSEVSSRDDSPKHLDDAQYSDSSDDDEKEFEPLGEKFLSEGAMGGSDDEHVGRMSESKNMTLEGSQRAGVSPREDILSLSTSTTDSQLGLIHDIRDGGGHPTLSKPDIDLDLNASSSSSATSSSSIEDSYSLSHGDQRDQFGLQVIEEHDSSCGSSLSMSSKQEPPVSPRVLESSLLETSPAETKDSPSPKPSDKDGDLDGTEEGLSVSISSKDGLQDSTSDLPPTPITPGEIPIEFNTGTESCSKDTGFPEFESSDIDGKLPSDGDHAPPPRVIPTGVTRADSEEEPEETAILSDPDAKMAYDQIGDITPLDGAARTIPPTTPDREAASPLASKVGVIPEDDYFQSKKETYHNSGFECSDTGQLTQNSDNFHNDPASSFSAPNASAQARSDVVDPANDPMQINHISREEKEYFGVEVPKQTPACDSISPTITSPSNVTMITGTSTVLVTSTTAHASSAMDDDHMFDPMSSSMCDPMSSSMIDSMSSSMIDPASAQPTDLMSTSMIENLSSPGDDHAPSSPQPTSKPQPASQFDTMSMSMMDPMTSSMNDSMSSSMFGSSHDLFDPMASSAKSVDPMTASMIDTPDIDAMKTSLMDCMSSSMFGETTPHSADRSDVMEGSVVAPSTDTMAMSMSVEGDPLMSMSMTDSAFVGSNGKVLGGGDSGVVDNVQLVSKLVSTFPAEEGTGAGSLPQTTTSVIKRTVITRDVSGGQCDNMSGDIENNAQVETVASHVYGGIGTQGGAVGDIDTAGSTIGHGLVPDDSTGGLSTVVTTTTTTKETVICGSDHSDGAPQVEKTVRTVVVSKQGEGGQDLMTTSTYLGEEEVSAGAQAGVRPRFQDTGSDADVDSSSADSESVSSVEYSGSYRRPEPRPDMPDNMADHGAAGGGDANYNINLAREQALERNLGYAPEQHL